MSHGAAINRLRKTLVPMLASGQQAMTGCSSKGSGDAVLR
jgi:hypothetical protein